MISGPSRGSVALDSASGTFVYAPTTSARLAAGQAAIIDYFTVAVTDGTATVEKVVPVTVAPAHLGTGADAATGTAPTGVAVFRREGLRRQQWLMTLSRSSTPRPTP